MLVSTPEYSGVRRQSLNSLVEINMTERIAVTVPEACKMLGLGRTTIYNLINEGKLKPRKSGNRTLFLVSDLHAFANNLPRAA